MEQKISPKRIKLDNLMTSIIRKMKEVKTNETKGQEVKDVGAEQGTVQSSAK